MAGMTGSGKQRAPLPFLAGLRRYLGGSLASSMSQLPGCSSNPALRVACGCGQEGLQSRLGQTKVACSSQAVCANQFALCSLDRITPLRFGFKLLGLLFLPPGLQVSVILSDEDGSMPLAFS